MAGDSLPSLFNQRAAILERIRGAELERQIFELAKIGGTKLSPKPQQPVRYSPTRLALTEADRLGRQYIADLMSVIGLEIDDTHPLGLLGKLPGKNPDAQPILLLSHTDTVPQADMYDGTTGVLSALAVAQAIKDAGVQPEHPLWILSLTGEESARFNRALFGSASFFHGLSDGALRSQSASGETIEQVLAQLDPEAVPRVRRPVFTSDQFLAVIELHVDQTGELEAKQADIAVVEAIAAPQRFAVTVGHTFAPNKKKFPFSQLLSITVAGQAGHSGTTPMGSHSRADGFVLLAEVLRFLKRVEADHTHSQQSIELAFGPIEIENQAINKIPGKVSVVLHIGADSGATLKTVAADIQNGINQIAQRFLQPPTLFPPNPISVRPTDRQPKVFFPTVVYEMVSLVVQAVNANALTHAEKKVVGTVGTFQVKNEALVLGVDIRGIDQLSRDQAVGDIWLEVATERNKQVEYQRAFLEGSSNPVQMDSNLVGQAENAIRSAGVGRVLRTFSAAGHDAMNAATAGAPTVMLFIPSVGGIAHHPDAFTSAASLEKGARALAALVCNLDDQAVVQSNP